MKAGNAADGRVDDRWDDCTDVCGGTSSKETRGGSRSNWSGIGGSVPLYFGDDLLGSPTLPWLVGAPALPAPEQVLNGVPRPASAVSGGVRVAAGESQAAAFRDAGAENLVEYGSSQATPCCGFCEMVVGML